MRKALGAPLLLFLLAVTGCQEGRETVRLERPEVTDVTVETVDLSLSDEYYEASGTIRSSTISVVSSRVMGTVTSVEVKEGDTVRLGQLLLALDDRDLREKVNAAREARNEALEAVEAARRQKELAEKTYHRFKMLHEERALTDQELDEVETKKAVAANELHRMEAALRRMEAAMKEARVFLGFARVVSPVDGVVSDKKVDVGTMATPGMPLIVVEDVSSYALHVRAAERFLGAIKRGMEARVEIPSTGESYEGTVTEVVPSVDPASRAFLAKISVEGDGLRNGMYGTARFPVGRKEALFIPEGAVVRKGQLTGVYAVGEGGLVTYRLIRTGKTYDAGIEVLSGLVPGERIVVGGVRNAVDGGVVGKAEGR